MENSELTGDGQIALIAWYNIFESDKYHVADCFSG